MKINLGITDKHVPDKSWMVKIPAHLNCKDEIFSKDYFPPPVKRKKEDPKIISLPSGFLKGLPIKQVSKRKSRVRLQITKEASKKIKEMRVKKKKDLLRIERVRQTKTYPIVPF